MNEFEFIANITPASYRQPSLQKGIGDDAAVIRTQQDIVTAVDTFIDGVHFTNQTMNAFQAGYRALAANISDIAAMGAMPKFYLVSITIPNGMSDAYINDVFFGMRTIADQFQMDLIGGDTVAGKQLSISVTIIGFVEQGKARYRSDAMEDDVVFVTGTLGDSRAGLHLLLEDAAVQNESYFIHRHRMPEPRVAFVRSLTSLKRLACNDISDGIANELNEIATASDLDIVIDEETLPTHPDFQQFTKSNQFQWKLFGGEDFELTGTVPQQDWPFLQKEAQKQGLRVTKIGIVKRKQGKAPVVFIKQDHQLRPLQNKGYIHLKDVTS